MDIGYTPRCVKPVNLVKLVNIELSNLSKLLNLVKLVGLLKPENLVKSSVIPINIAYECETAPTSQYQTL